MSQDIIARILALTAIGAGGGGSASYDIPLNMGSGGEVTTTKTPAELIEAVETHKTNIILNLEGTLIATNLAAYDSIDDTGVIEGIGYMIDDDDIPKWIVLIIDFSSTSIEIALNSQIANYTQGSNIVIDDGVVSVSSSGASAGDILVADGDGGASWTTIPDANGVNF